MFRSEASDCERVLDGGPWLFDGGLMVIRKWDKEVGLERDLLSSIPIWIRLPAMDVKLLSKKAISRVTSVGKETTVHGQSYSIDGEAFICVMLCGNLCRERASLQGEDRGAWERGSGTTGGV